MPSGIQSFLSHRTSQSSCYSDNVFLSTSAISSSLSLHHANVARHMPVDSQFLAIPSSTSMISSDQQTSNVSDASGQSGIESSNLRTSISELPHTASINEEEEEEQQQQGTRTKTEKNLLHLQLKRSTSGSSRSTQTASTESLPTSGKKPRTPYDQRLHVLRQLAWLLEKRPPIHPRLNPTRRKPAQALVSARSSISNENSNQVHSLPINSHRPHSPSSSQALTSCVDPLTQSYSSIRSIHSDSSLNPSLINTKAPSSNPNPGTTSLNSSLHLQRNTPSSNTNQSQRRRTGQHRRNLSGRAAVHRDRKNSFSKSNTNKLDEQSTTSQTTQQQAGPLVRDIKAILEEHLAMINDLITLVK
ncbi:unnamed protein product [Adineta ricciae]|uniref:Uncharacterized protein n=1 Tax=Adineta ricciae TaxID=249248 RepID=A0A815RGH2_ADIRI|nr:unnamed protein product [Adineta ricciae]